MSCPARNNDTAAFPRLVHEVERIPVAFEAMDRFTGDQFADEQRTHLDAWRVKPIPAMPRLIVCANYGTGLIVNWKRDVVLIHADQSALIQPGTSFD